MTGRKDERSGIDIIPIMYSEFEDSTASFLQKKLWGCWIGGAVCLTTVLILILGFFCDANALCIEIEPILNPKVLTVCAYKFWSGYLAEINHGLFYLILVPICFVLLNNFFNDANESLARLVTKGRLSNDAIKVLSERNKRWFCFPQVLTTIFQLACSWFKRVDGSKEEESNVKSIPLLFVFIIAAFVINFVKEVPTIYWGDSAKGERKCVGYIQRPCSHLWIAKYKEKNTEFERLKKIGELKGLYRGVLTELEKTVLLDKDLVHSWSRAQAISKRSSQECPTAREIENYFSNSTSVNNLRIVMEKAAEKSLIKFSMKSNIKQITGVQLFVHLVFVALIISVESTLHGFAAWTAFKTVFWLNAVFEFLPTAINSEDPLCFKPEFNDGCYGLRPIHTTYYSIIYLTCCASFVGVAMYENSSGKGFVSGSTVIDATLVALGATLIFVLFVLGPMLLFEIKLSGLKKQKMKKLDIECGQTNSEQERSRIEKEQNTLDSQATWPVGDRMFSTALIFAGVMLTIPILNSVAALDIMPKEAKQYVNFHGAVRGQVDNLCEFYVSIFKHENLI